MFWHSGLQPELIDWLKQEVFPAFEREHGVTIEELALGWGAPREEKLAVAFAAGVGPDIIVGSGNANHTIPLDAYFERWAEKASIVPAFLIPMRDVQGVLKAIPHEAEVRGFAYSKQIAFESGLDADSPPASWDELLAWARQMTRIEGDQVTRSGFETVWGTPFVGSEFDWFLQQAGGSVASPDMRESTILSEAGLAAIEVMKELYEIGHPPHAASSINESMLASGGAAIARGGPWVIDPWLEAHGSLDGLGVFAPRMSPETRPVAITFVNGFAITDQAKNPDLAWKLIERLLSFDAQDALAKYNFRLATRTDVGVQFGVPHIDLFAPWYRIAEFAAPPGFFPGRSDAARALLEALRGERPPNDALRLMHVAQQVAIDHFWEQ